MIDTTDGTYGSTAEYTRTVLAVAIGPATHYGVTLVWHASGNVSVPRVSCGAYRHNSRMRIVGLDLAAVDCERCLAGDGGARYSAEHAVPAADVLTIDRMGRMARKDGAR